jgi:large subunit ribosomal protein L31
VTLGPKTGIASPSQAFSLVRKCPAPRRRHPVPLKEAIFLKQIHPELTLATVRCTSCGNTFTVRSTRGELVLDVCSNCHPIYTGIEREARSGSRIERFERRRRLADTQTTRK